MSIYTGNGDQGYTNLFGDTLYSKSNLIFEVLGTFDELSSCLGFVHVYKNEGINRLIKTIQRDLFSFGAEIGGSDNTLDWDDRVTFLEETINFYEDKLEKLESFILPGGSIFSSYLNLARSVCRRLERHLVRYGTSGSRLVYTNRLSDLLFVLGRYVNKLEETPDIMWKKDNF